MYNTTIVLILVALTGHSKFSVRDRATEKLVAYGAAGIPLNFADMEVDIEVKNRLSIIAEKIDEKFTEKLPIDIVQFTARFEPLPYFDALPPNYPERSALYVKYRDKSMEMGIPYSTQNEQGKADFPADRNATKLWIRDELRRGTTPGMLEYFLKIMKTKTEYHEAAGKYPDTE